MVKTYTKNLVNSYRIQKGLSMRGLAKLTGFSATYVHMVEHKAQSVPPNNLDAICLALEMTDIDRLKTFEEYGICPAELVPKTVEEFTIMRKHKEKKNG